VAASVAYTPVADVAAIPASPANNTYISVTDSTGLQSFTPLSGIPSGFTGDAGLTARLVYKTASTSWVWIDYYANNADSRYLKLSGGGMTGPLLLSGAPTAALNPATKGYVDSADATLATAAAAAQTTANTGVTNAAAAQSTANTAVANAAAAQTTANTANTTANTALTNAAAAQTTANTANTTANAALPKAGGTMTGAIVFDLPTQQKATTSTYGITQLTNSTTSTDTGTAATAAAVKVAKDAADAAQAAATTANTTATTANTTANTANTTATTANTTANTANTTANAALPKAGGTMTGAIILSGAPTTGLNPATKTYVDTADSTLATAASAAQSTANTGVTNAAAAQTTANTGVTNAAAAQTTANAANTTANAANTTANTANTTANAALPKAGGTMTGAIVFDSAQATATTAAAGIVQLTNSTTSTSTTTAATPNSVKSAADLASAAGTVANAALPTAGGTMTGNIAFASTQPQVCKAWVNFNGTGTVAIRASYNVSSITDNAVGYYRVNLTTAMPDINYSITGSCASNGTSVLGTIIANTNTSGGTVAPTTSAFTLVVSNFSTSIFDSAYVNVAVFR
jgi:hypothetical protein